jgi:hypothetical protein
MTGHDDCKKSLTKWMPSSVHKIKEKSKNNYKSSSFHCLVSINQILI